MHLYVTALGFGLVTASVLAIPAVGFTLQFAITGILNLAFGAIMICSAYITYGLGQYGVNIWVGLAAGAVGGAILSFAINYLIFEPFRRRKSTFVTMIVVSLSVGIVITNGLLAMVGGNSVGYGRESGTPIRIGDIQLTTTQLAIIGLGIACMVAIHVMLKFTRLGKSMRATAVNPDLARNSGIRVSSVTRITWLVSGALCGLGGSIFALDTGAFSPGSTGVIGMIVLSAAVLGGVGSAYGAMVGAVAVGLSVELSAVMFAPSYKYVVAFVVLVALMIFRPEGILVRRARG